MRRKWLEQITALLFSGLYFIVASRVAASKPYWLDETVSVALAALPSVTDLLTALAEGKDAHPPLSYLLIRLSFALFGSGELPARIPSILAFFGALAATYHFLRFRFPVPTALAGALLLAISPAGYYATEARSYALLLGASAGAALAWQRRSHVGLGLALAIAISSHYYALLLAPVFGLATLVRDRRAAGPSLAAIAAGFTPLLVFLPLIHAARTVALVSWQFNPDNIARPSLGQIGRMAHEVFFHDLFPLLLLAGLLLFRWRRPGPGHAPLPTAEAALAGSLLLLPPALLLINAVTLGAFFQRYVIAWHLGPAILLASAVAALSTRPAVQWAFIASCLFGPLLAPRLYLPQSTAGAELTAQWPKLPLPDGLEIVYSDALEYNSVWFYSPHEIRRRLVYVHDLSIARLTRDPVPEHIITQLNRSILPYRAETYTDFLKSRSSFLLFSTSERDREWLPDRLRAEGYQFAPLHTLSRHTLYRVSPPNPASD